MKMRAAKSKRQKLSLKYNIQKRVRESKRRVRKEAKKLGIRKPQRRDPGIPNNWPFKAEMLNEIEAKKAKKEEEIVKKRAQVKQQLQRDRKIAKQNSAEHIAERDAARKLKRAQEMERHQTELLRKTLLTADVLLEVLDARDPQGCRCAALEALAAKEGKRLIFVLTKADLVPAEAAKSWLQALGQVGPAVVVSPEVGREGVADLLRMLGHGAAGQAGAVAAKAVSILGYEGTGKKTLMKALRVEAKTGGVVPWLFDSPVKLLPVPSEAPKMASATDAHSGTMGTDGMRALHLAIRGALPKGVSGDAIAAPVLTVKALVERSSAQVLARRFRLPAFEGAEAFIAAFGKDREVKSKRGHEGSPEVIARKIIAELAVGGNPKAPLPHVFCTVPPTFEQGPGGLWIPFGNDKAALVSIVENQLGLLAKRPAPAGTLLPVGSGGLGPVVDLAKALEAPAANDAAMEEEEDDESEDDDDEEGEGEEEEMGEESEEEDDDMDDDM